MICLDMTSRLCTLNFVCFCFALGSSLHYSGGWKIRIVCRFVMHWLAVFRASTVFSVSPLPLVIFDHSGRWFVLGGGGTMSGSETAPPSIINIINGIQQYHLYTTHTLQPFSIKIILIF
mgnify:CR=1 FL=1